VIFWYSDKNAAVLSTLQRKARRMSAAREEIARADSVSLLEGEEPHQPAKETPTRRSILIKPEQAEQVSLVRPRRSNGRLSLVKRNGK
jgi:hypothetical protein